MRNHSLIVGVTLCLSLVALAACCLALCGARVQGQQLGRGIVDSLLREAEYAESCAARLEAWESLCNCYYVGRDSILLLGAFPNGVHGKELRGCQQLFVRAHVEIDMLL